MKIIELQGLCKNFRIQNKHEGILGSIRDLFSNDFRFNDYAKYPATIFKGLLKMIFTFIIPVAFVAYYPAMFFLRPGEGGISIYLSPLIGLVMFTIAYKIWTFGINRYSGTGS